MLEVKLQAVVGFAGDAGREKSFRASSTRCLIATSSRIRSTSCGGTRASRATGTRAFVTVRVGPGRTEDVEEVVVVS